MFNDYNLFIAERLARVLEAESGIELHKSRYHKLKNIPVVEFERLGIYSFADLEAGVSNNLNVREAFIAFCTVNETYFFRELFVVEQIVDCILKRLEAGETVVYNVLGCSTGEEVYSVAMLLSMRGTEEQCSRCSINGIDIDYKVLERARGAVYSLYSVKEVPNDILSEYFEAISHREYRLKTEKIKLRIGFLNKSLVSPKDMRSIPISNVSSCRNTMIYFSKATLRKVLFLIHGSMSFGGDLFLSRKETIGVSRLFSVVRGKMLYYRKEQK